MTWLLVGLFLGAGAGFAFGALAAHVEVDALERELKARRDCMEVAGTYLWRFIRTSENPEYMRSVAWTVHNMLLDSAKVKAHIVSELPSERRAREKRKEVNGE